MTATAVEASGVVLRHVRRRLDPTVSEAGEIAVLGTHMVPGDLRGLNTTDPPQWATADPERRLGEEGTATLTIANTVGGDGVPHRDRFLVLADRAGYQIGDEWIEFYEHNGVGAPQGDPFWVGTPVGATATTGQITLKLEDALTLMKGQRETAAGFWTHAPRDVFEHYCGAWTPVLTDTFDGAILSIPAGWSEFNGPAGGNHLNGDGQLLVSTAVTGTSYRGLQRTIDLSAATRWSIETTVAFMADATATGEIRVGFLDADSRDTYVALSRDPGADPALKVLIYQSGIPTKSVVIAGDVVFPLGIRFESDGHWLYVYTSGQLQAVSRLVAPPAQVRVGTSTATVAATLDSFLVRECRALLLTGGDTGDYRLPGAPTTGGLVGEYFDDADIKTQPDYQSLVLNPTRQPYARRMDPGIDFASTNPPVWMPAGPYNGEYFSVRWTGAIYLDLAAADRKVAVDFGTTTSGSQICRVWIGRTRWGEQVVDYNPSEGVFVTASGGLAATLGDTAGWFPIVVERVVENGAIPDVGMRLLDKTVVGGSYSVVGSDRLSPEGTYNAQVRYESHYDQLIALRDTFGLQFTCAPRSLESGGFPGQIIPRVREGRDTALIVDSLEGSDVQTDVDATTAVATLLADAQGIATDNAQLTEEAINFDAVAADHLCIRSEYESLPDVSIPELVTQRLNSMLALGSSPFEQIGVRPPRARDFIDSFPLTGTAARFDWQPGDGVRLNLPEVGVVDQTPRQVLGVKWPCNPDGKGKPQVAFRQRPRGLDLFLRKIYRSALQPQRNYQGQLVTLTGTVGSTFSYLALPAAFTAVKGELIVGTVGAGGWSLFVNDVDTGIDIDRPGAYDITGWIAAKVNQRRMYAVLTGGTGDYTMQLHATIRI